MVKRAYRLGLLMGMLCMMAGAVTVYMVFAQESDPEAPPEATGEVVVEPSATPSPTWTPTVIWTSTVQPTEVIPPTATPLPPQPVMPTEESSDDPAAEVTAIVEPTLPPEVTEEPVIAPTLEITEEPLVAPTVEVTEEPVIMEPTAEVTAEVTVEVPPTEVTEEPVVPQPTAEVPEVTEEPVVPQPTIGPEITPEITQEPPVIEPTVTAEVTEEPIIEPTIAPELTEEPTATEPGVEVTDEPLPPIEDTTPAQIMGLVDLPSNVAVSVQLIDSNGGVAEGQVDEQGKFLFGELAPGSYRVEASAAGFLSRQVELIVEPGGEYMLPPAILAAGDTNGDGVIDMLDVMLIAANFDGPADVPEADVNHDGWVDIRDLSVTGSQFGLAGPLPWS
ncbi:MAG: hypothetical protein K8L99_32045 [Anaerolineae bacterium]|nr:hypothetical protein [Anaerolineae bacterium]